MTEELRKLSGFYDNNDHFTDTVTTAQEISDEHGYMIISILV